MYQAMSRTLSRRLLAQWPLQSSLESATTCRQQIQCLRPFSTTPRRRAEGDDNRPPAGNYKALRATENPSSNPTSTPKMTDLLRVIEFNKDTRKQTPTPSWQVDISQISSDGSVLSGSGGRPEEPYHFHVYATRHNTHIAVTDPKRNPLLSLSCGNIGFTKSGRKHYDSAFQLAAFVMGKMHERGLTAKITQMEVILRGFGAGREAVTKALLGSEGRFLRGKVTKVTDATRLKFGGTRSPNPRRLG
ncbi:hypothetical protein B7494_g5417 [Chlorociboria aeruginascens]|nr:hypothetical protein B7494_g5417 [Chlorociboria aeruginascens]